MRFRHLTALLITIALSGCASSTKTVHLVPSSWGTGETLLGVRSLAEDGASQRAGIRSGDLVFRVDDKEVYTPEAFEAGVREGDGPIQIVLIREGVEWNFSLSETARSEGTGMKLAPMYRIFSKRRPPIALAEGRQSVVTAWVNSSDELTIVDIEIENLSQDAVEVAPDNIQVLNAERRLIRPYHPRDLSRSYMEDAEIALGDAQALGPSGGRTSFNLSSADPITAIAGVLLTAIPLHNMTSKIRNARRAHTRAEAIMDRAYQFGSIPGLATQEGLLYYPLVEQLPLTLVIRLHNESFSLVFEKP